MCVRKFTALAIVLAACTAAAAQQPPKVYLGITPAPPAAGTSGIVLEDVDPNGPSAKAGLRPGDRIVKVNDQAVAGDEAFLEILAKLKPGDKLALVAVRGGQ